MTAPSTTTAPFPQTRARERGYDRTTVDAFLARARTAFDDPATEMTSAAVRDAAFPLVRRGYAIAPVDAALGRLEDAFAVREREREMSSVGRAAWVERTRDDAQVILDRLTRPRGARFDRVGWMRFGYRVDEVDLVADRISAYLSSGATVSVEQVRGAAFRMQRRGYSETQVDAVLDGVVEVMLAVG